MLSNAQSFLQNALVVPKRRGWLLRFGIRLSRHIFFAMPGNQIVDNLFFLLRIDWCSVTLDHLVYLSRPGLSRKCRLVEHISRRMADDTLRRKDVLPWPRRQIGCMIVQVDLFYGLHFRQARNRNHRCWCRQRRTAFAARPSPQGIGQHRHSNAQQYDDNAESLHYATTSTSSVWMTLRQYPPWFHSEVDCVSPAALVARHCRL